MMVSGAMPYARVLTRSISNGQHSTSIQRNITFGSSSTLVRSFSDRQQRLFDAWSSQANPDTGRTTLELSEQLTELAKTLPGVNPKSDEQDVEKVVTHIRQGLLEGLTNR